MLPCRHGRPRHDDRHGGQVPGGGALLLAPLDVAAPVRVLGLQRVQHAVTHRPEAGAHATGGGKLLFSRVSMRMIDILT